MTKSTARKGMIDPARIRHDYRVSNTLSPFRSNRIDRFRSLDTWNALRIDSVNEATRSSNVRTLGQRSSDRTIERSIKPCLIRSSPRINVAVALRLYPTLLDIFLK